MKPVVLLERFPYRYVEVGILDNGTKDYRIQKCDAYTNRYMQIDLAMEDFEYTKWLDPDGVPSYVKDTVSRYE